MISSFKKFSLILYRKFTVPIYVFSQRGCVYNSTSTVSPAAEAFPLYSWGIITWPGSQAGTQGTTPNFPPWLRPLVELCVEPAGLCGRCPVVAVPLRVVPSPTGLPSKRGPVRSSSCLGRKPPRAPQLEETPETPPSSRAEGLLFLHGLESNPGPESPDVTEDDLSMMSFPQPGETARRSLRRRLPITTSSGGCAFWFRFALGKTVKPQKMCLGRS